MTTRSLITRVIQVVVFTLVVIFIGIYLRDQFSQLNLQELTINWVMLLVAQVGMAIGLAILPLGSYLMLRALDSSLSGIVVWRIFFLSNVAKYLPGSIWALPGRAFLYQRNGISTTHSVMAVFLEVLLMVAAAGVTALLSLRLVMHYVPALIVYVGLLIGFSVCVMFTWGLWSGKIVEWLSGRSSPALLQRLFNQPDLGLSQSKFLHIFCSYLLAWLIIGASFTGMVLAVNTNITFIQIFEMIGLYAGTWMIGFLVIITPGGIGVRDGLIILGLSVFLPEPFPALVAIIARISWTLAEVTCLLVALLIFRRSLNILEPQCQLGDTDESTIQNTP